MANQMALNYGKRYMNKKLNLGRDSTVDDSGVSSPTYAILYEGILIS